MADIGSAGRPDLTTPFGGSRDWRGNSGAAALWPLTGYDLLWVDANPASAAFGQSLSKGGRPSP